MGLRPRETGPMLPPIKVARLFGLGSLLLFVLGLVASISVERTPGTPDEWNIHVVIDALSGSLFGLTIVLLGCYLFLRRRAAKR